MKLCRICLSKDGRLYSITSNGLRSLYHQLIGVVKLEINADKGLPQWVCAECALRLMSYNKLRQKSLRSHQILTKLLDRLTCITEEDINKIDREKNKLQSDLSYSVLDQDIVQEYETDTQKTDDKPSIKEFFIEFAKGETSFVFKTEKNSNKSLSKNAVSNSDCESDFSDDTCPSSDSSSIDKSLKPQSSNSLKTDDKKLFTNSLITEDKKVPIEIINSLDKTTIKRIKVELKKEIKKEQEIPKKLIVKVIKKNLDSDPLDNVSNSLEDEEKKVPSILLTKTLHKNTKKTVKNKVKDEVKIEETTKRLKVNVVLKKNTKPSPIEDVFTVQTLSLKEQMTEFETKKYSKSYTDAPFKCNDCFNGFNSEETFARHKLMHSEAWGKLECNICKKRLRSKKMYYIHMRAHRTIYSCKECRYITNTRSIALMHRLKHKGKVYICAHCGSEFVNQSSYLSHLRLKHVSQFVCEYCGYSFVSAKGVDKHKNIKHTIEINNEIGSMDGPTCPTCNIRLATDKALDTHLRVSHSQEDDLRKLNNHYGECEDKKSIICELCGLETSNGQAYREHCRRTHPNKRTNFPTTSVASQQFVCEQCGLAYKCARYLEKHAQTHAGAMPFECHDCHKRFIFKQFLRRHIVSVHVQPRPDTSQELYLCGICEKEFPFKCNLKRHMIKHTALRPCICEVCGRSFKTKGEVNAHTKHVHLKKPWPKKKERKSRQGALVVHSNTTELGRDGHPIPTKCERIKPHLGLIH